MKSVLLTNCVYCEASIDDILAAGQAETEEDALRFVLIGESQVLLCPKCRQEQAAWFDEDVDQLLNGPITFPPGVTAVEHTCPELEYQGLSGSDATRTLQMERRGEYYYATCEHCGVTVRSIADDDPI